MSEGLIGMFGDAISAPIPVASLRVSALRYGKVVGIRGTGVISMARHKQRLTHHPHQLELECTTDRLMYDYSEANV